MHRVPAVQSSPDTDRPDTALSRVISWLGSALDARDPAADPRPVGARAVAHATWMTALDMVSAIRTRRTKARERARQPATASLVIHAPPAVAYATYRELSCLPLFMDHVISVREADRWWSHWVARLPSGTIAWDVKITDDDPGELIAWRSVKGSVIDVRGRVSFAAIDQGVATEVRIEVRLGAIANRRARGLAALFSTSQIERDLRRFKDLVEAGDPTCSDTARPRARPDAPPPPSDGPPGGAEHRTGDPQQMPLAW
jgi:uncharacterized membrane protein